MSDPSQIKFDCYSFDEERWYEGDREEAVQHMLDFHGDIDLGDHFLVGVRVPFSHGSFIDADRLIDVMQEDAWTEVGDLAEGYLDDLTPELRLELDAVLSKWFEDHAQQPTFWRVSYETETKVTKEDLERLEVTA